MISNGAQIRAGRALLGWTRPMLAAAAGLHKNAVAYWERHAVIPTEEFCVPIGVALIDEALARAGVEAFVVPTAGVRLCQRTKKVTSTRRVRAHVMDSHAEDGAR